MCCEFGSQRLPGQTAQTSDHAEDVDALDVQFTQGRPQLERPVDEQEHVADRGASASRSSLTRGDSASCRPRGSVIAYLLARGSRRPIGWGRDRDRDRTTGGTGCRSLDDLRCTSPWSCGGPSSSSAGAKAALHWWTDIPVGLLAVALIGPAQHRLLILGQEAALGVLFRNRWLNELVGDWLIHFPFSTATHHVRQQVLAHYQFPNDPGPRRRAGHRPPGRVLAAAVRPAAAAVGHHPLARRCGRTTTSSANPNNPFFDPARPPSKVALHIGTVYVLLDVRPVARPVLLPARVSATTSSSHVLTYVLPACGCSRWCVFSLLPESKYHRGRLEGVYSREDDDADADHVHHAGERWVSAGRRF